MTCGVTTVSVSWREPSDSRCRSFWFSCRTRHESRVRSKIALWCDRSSRFVFNSRFHSHRESDLRRPPRVCTSSDVDDCLVHVLHTRKRCEMEEAEWCSENVFGRPSSAKAV